MWRYKGSWIPKTDEKKNNRIKKEDINCLKLASKHETIVSGAVQWYLWMKDQWIERSMDQSKILYKEETMAIQQKQVSVTSATIKSMWI